MKTFTGIISFLFVLSLLLNLSSACSEGCIKCELTPEGVTSCKICDFYNSYYFDSVSSQCTKREIENCLIPSVNQNEALCSQCKQGFLLDNTLKKCVEVPSNLVVENCRSYSLVGNCSACYRDHYLKDGQCNKAEVLIENCHTYFTDDLCSQCEKGYYYDIETSSCISFEAVENCSTHSHGQCRACDDGLILNQNSIFFVDMDESFVQKYGNYFWNQVNFSNTPISYCVKEYDDHCLEFSTEMAAGKAIHICSKCEEYYFLDVATGKCTPSPQWKVENCATYLDFKICSKCSDEFYLECNECKARATYSNCLEKAITADHCALCEETHYLNSSNQCTLRNNYPIAGCSQLHYSEDLCMACSNNDVLTEDQLACFSTISNCDEIREFPYKSEGSLICYECATDYVLNATSTECLHQNILNCTDYEPDTLTCTECDEGFYLNTDLNSCPAHTVPNCAVNNLNLNTCKTCKNLFALADDDINCEPIGDSNCLQNTENEKDCVKCKANFYIAEDSDTIKRCTASSKIHDVTYCQDSSSDEETKICSSCEENYVLVDIENVAMELPSGCAQIDSSTGKCTLCLPGYNSSTLTSSEDLSCSAESSGTTKCSQIIEEYSANLGDNDGLCGLCSSPDSVIYNFNTCWNKSSLLTNSCESFSDTEECNVCKEGYVGADSEAPENYECVAEPSGFASISNCLVYNYFDPTQCVQCESSFRLTSAFTCVNDDKFSNWQVIYSFQADINSIFNSSLNSSDQKEYCSHWGLYNAVSECIKLQPGYIPHSKIYIFSTINGFLDSGFVDGIQYADLSKKTSGTDKVHYVQENECAEAIKLGDGFGCIRCANGVNSKFINSEFLSDDSANSGTIPTVVNCTNDGSELILSKQYSSMNLRTGKTSEEIELFSHQFYYDSCPTTTENLIYLLDLDNISNDNYKIPGDGTVAQNKFICHDVENSYKVDNCHVYTAQLSTTDNDVDYTAEELFCLSCKPGFAPTYTNAYKITACTPINFCETSDPANNLWMNGCQTCQSGYTHPVKETDSLPFIDFTSCFQNTKANCLYENSNDNHCYVCANGYTPNTTTGECDANASTPTNCDEEAFMSSQTRFTASSLSLYFATSISYLLDKYRNSMLKKTCNTCTASNILVGKSQLSSDFKCVAHADASPPPDSNCLKFSGAEANKCVECKTGFLLNAQSVCTSTPVVSDASALSNCSSFTETDGVVECSGCNTGYLLQVNTKSCVSIEHCNVLSDDGGEVVCSICDPGYMKDPRYAKRCIPIYIPFCLEVGIENTCLKCADGKRLITILKNGPLKYCSSLEYNEPNSIILEAVYTIESSGSDVVSGDEISVTYNSGYGKIDNSLISTLDGKFVNQVCHKPSMPNCTEYDYTNRNIICNDCDEGYFLEPSIRQCVQNNIEHCKTQNLYYECGVCETGYFLNVNKICEVNTSENCSDKSITSNTCTTCNEEFYNSSGVCLPYTELLNCQTRNQNKDKCHTCMENFYLGADELCHVRTNLTCGNYERTADECSSCLAKYYKVNNICYRHTVTNCNEYANNADRCNDCLTNGDTSTHLGNFRLDDDGDCVPIEEHEGCKTYDLSPTADPICVECNEGYYYFNNECVKNPYGVPNCLEYSSPTVCLQCEFDYFVDSATQTCEPVYRPIKDCYIHASATTCKECKADFLLSSDSASCVMKTELSCLTWATYDSCATCSPSLVLTTSSDMSSDGTNNINTCESSNINNCLAVTSVTVDETQTDNTGATVTVQVSKVQCTQCAVGYILNEDSDECISPSPVMNCLSYTAHMECMRCHPGYVLNVKKDRCLNELQSVGQGCSDAYLSSDVKCHVCASGYMMGADGVCVECGGGGCSLCSPMNTAQCLLCAPGHYMTSSNTCSENSNTSATIEPESIDPVTNRLLSQSNDLDSVRVNFNR